MLWKALVVQNTLKLAWTCSEMHVQRRDLLAFITVGSTMEFVAKLRPWPSQFFLLPAQT